MHIIQKSLKQGELMETEEDLVLQNINLYGREEFINLGLLMDELSSGSRDEDESCKEGIVHSSLLEHKTSLDVFVTLAIAWGSRAAEMAYDSGALGDAVIDGHDDDWTISEMAGDSLKFFETFEHAFLRAVSVYYEHDEALQKEGMANVEEFGELAKSAYHVFCEPYIAEEIENF
jgi:hypothetical protein